MLSQLHAIGGGRSAGANGREIETSISAKSVPRMGFGRRSGFRVGIAGLDRTKGLKRSKRRYMFVIAGNEQREVRAEVFEKFEQTPMPPNQWVRIAPPIAAVGFAPQPNVERLGIEV